ncbi:MAG: YkgJ family cysteine cluster protein [Dehalococcoidaceae bacterium]|nr:YkgJ family cysteine cluster protein [Dehalococcoidaceae bacterium]
MVNKPGAAGNSDYKLILNNQAEAYSGITGSKREKFCQDYITKKKQVFKQIHAKQLDAVSKTGKTISCHNGCTYCCMAYMQANIQECEAIVYYLYQNEQKLWHFINNYTVWREKLEQNGDMFIRCGESWLGQCQPGGGEQEPASLQEMEVEYRRQNILCPFIIEGSCSIYEVRPFTCAAIVATSPPEWCSPASSEKPATHVIRVPEIFDSGFYYGKIEGTVLAFMPLTVYSILKEGYKLLSGIPGLEGLDEISAGAGPKPFTDEENDQQYTLNKI